MRNIPPTRVWARAVLALGLCALAGCSSPPASATSAPAGVGTDGVAITHVDQRYIEDMDFRRISEYFTGQENTSGRLIERTDPQQRAGYYFIVSLAWHPHTTLPAGTQADVDYIRKDDPQPRHAHFTFSAPTGTFNEILLGLTGTDWTDQDATMVAWKVTLKDAAGAVLADRQSFLWSLPENASASTAAITNAEPAKPTP
jgi:hypothetical protein